MSLRPVLDQVSATPAIQAAGGRAWRRPLAGLAIGEVALVTQVASWIVEAPWAHPVWHSYWLTLIHLRDLPGLPPPVMYLDGATHELILFALDPEQPRQPMLEGGQVRFLQPANFAAQLKLIDDIEADAKAEWIAQAIVEGRLNPDTDARSQWIALFGDNMIRRGVGN